MGNSKAIFLKTDVESSFKELLGELNSNIFGLKNPVFSKTNSFSLGTQYQHVYGFKHESALKKCLFELVLNYSLKAEKYAPNSLDLFLECLNKYFFNGLIEDINGNETQKYLSFISNRSQVNDLKNIINSLSNTNISELVNDALNLAGYGGKIIIEKSNSTDLDSIELTKGYTFYIQPAWQISAKLKDVKIMVIDGYIENVHEIHHLLQNFHDQKEVGLLFVRGLGNDVLATLKVNWERGSLKILPIVVPFDLEGINSLNDIAVISGCDVISSNKGNLISSIDYCSLPVVEEVDVAYDKFCIKNNATYSAVVSHRNYLKDKRDAKNEVADVASLYDHRIRSLTPNHVLIRLRDDVEFVQRSQLIDLALRQIKSLVDYGVQKNEAETFLTSRLIVDFFAKKCYGAICGIGSVLIC